MLPEAAFADFNLKLPMPGMDDILAAGIFYKENGFLYPVITGHRGSGSTWHKDFTDKLCHATGTRLGQIISAGAILRATAKSARE